jgi:Zn-dependent membrane protease YugP
MEFLILIGIPLILGIWAQFKVSSTYNKYLQVPSRGRITGAEAAKFVMDRAGIHDVDIVPIGGKLTDYYDPTNKRLALSQDNYHGTSLAALGVAAHEAGHAIQHKVGYAMLNLRMLVIPATSIASQTLPFLIFGSFFLPFLLPFKVVVPLIVLAYLVITIFQLITLPVEFDASKRAKEELIHLGIIQQDEMVGVKQTLDAAAWTYVAAFVTSLGSLLYYLLHMLGNRD